MQDLAQSLRNQYSMAYFPPTNPRRQVPQDQSGAGGARRRSLTVIDQKGKKVKFQVYARQGYTAPKSNVDPTSKVSRGRSC